MGAMDKADKLGGADVEMPRPLVSVIVPHYQDLVQLDACLSALERQTFDRNAFEIIVADNNSPVGEARVAEVIGGRARMTVIDQKGAGPARNGGAHLARGEIFAFTDSDCVPEPGWLAEGIKCLENYDLVGGRVRVLVEDVNAMTPEEAFECVYAFDNKTYVNREFFTVTASLFCRKSVFLDVGDFLGVGVSEDIEWCWRAKERGFKIGYAELSIVGHPARRSWADLMKKWKRMNAELFGLSLRKPRGRFLWLVRSLMLPLSAFVMMPKAVTDTSLTTVGQRLAAIVTLYKVRFWQIGYSLGLLVRG